MFQEVAGDELGSVQPASDCSQCVVWGGGEKSGKLQKVRGAPAPWMLDRKPWETRLYSPGLLVFSYKNLCKKGYKNEISSMNLYSKTYSQ